MGTSVPLGLFLYSLLITAWTPSLCGIFRYNALTSIVASVQSVGILVSSSMRMMCPLSLIYESTVETSGCRCISMNSEILSVGPPHPLTIGLTAMGVLCIFLRGVRARARARGLGARARG